MWGQVTHAEDAEDAPSKKLCTICDTSPCSSSSAAAADDAAVAATSSALERVGSSNAIVQNAQARKAFQSFQLWF
jgi:hypothetical protein